MENKAWLDTIRVRSENVIRTRVSEQAKIIGSRLGFNAHKKDETPKAWSPQ